MSGGLDVAMALPAHPAFLFFPPVRSWMRLRSTGSKFISYLTPILTRTRSSRSRPESWRWERDPQLRSAVTELRQTLPSAGLVTDTILFLSILASPHFIPFCLIPLFSISPSSDFVSLSGYADLYLPFPGEHSLCCDWLQPADWGEGEEDPWSSLPLGSCWSGEPWTQWLPQITYNACVSLPGNKTS